MLNEIIQYFKTRKSISFAHKWNIANYSRLSNENHPWKWKICSDCFSPQNNQLFKFAFCLYPKGDCETWKDYVSIGLYVYDLPQIYEGRIRCRWKVSIEDETGDKCWTEETKSYTLFSDEETIIPDYIEYSQLFNCASQYFPLDQLTLHFEVHLQADERIFNVITNNELGMSRFDCANKVTKVEHTWTVENFGVLFGEENATLFFIQSDNFPALHEQSEQFYLRLYPNGTKEKSKNNVEVVIQNDNQNSATVHWRMWILDLNNEECCTQEWAGKIFLREGRCFGVNRASLFDNSNGLVEDNKFRIFCEMSYMMDKKQITDNRTPMSNFVLKSKSITDVSNKTFHYVPYQWTIDKFSSLCHKSPKNHWIGSQIFNLPTDPRIKFYFRLWQNSPNSKDYIALDLFNITNVIQQVTVQYRISILGANGDKTIMCSDQTTFVKNEKIRLPNFMPLSSFKTKSLIKQYLPNEALTIIFELWAIQDRKIHKTLFFKPQSPIANNSSGSLSAVLNMSNANFQGAIINVQSVSSVGDFNAHS